MLNIDNKSVENVLLNYIEFNEGRRTEVYLDSEGIKTIGVGFNLERDISRERIEEVGANYDDILSGNSSLTNNQITELLRLDLEDSIPAARRQVANFNNITVERQIVIVDMVFNLGETGYSRFVNTRAAIENENWGLAAKEMRNSKWATQVGSRATRNIEAMRTSRLPDQWQKRLDELRHKENGSFNDLFSIEKFLRNLKVFFNRLFVPYKKGIAPNGIISITSFGIELTTDNFSKSLSITFDPNSQDSFLQAYFTGTIEFQAVNSSILLRNGDLLGEVVRKANFPSWLPLPRLAIYENIDQAESRQILLDYIKSDSTLIERIKKDINVSVVNIETAEDIIELFFSGTTSIRIPIETGTVFARAGFNQNNNRQLNFYLKEKSDENLDLFLDPAFYFSAFSEYFEDLEGREEVEQLKRIFAGVKSNGVVRFINKSSAANPATGPFTDPSKPASSIKTAINVANDYDTLMILDTSTYKEGVISLDKGVHITHFSEESAIGDQNPAFPTISGDNKSRVFILKNQSGIAGLSRLKIKEGLLKEKNGVNGGGGILIEKADKVFIGNCIIEGNKNEIPGNEIDDDGFGGGMHVYYSSPLLFENLIQENTSSGRGGGIGVFGYGWPSIIQNIIQNNESKGDGIDGGGVAVQISHPSDLFTLGGLGAIVNLKLAWDENELSQAGIKELKLIRCDIKNNETEDDGGGLYASVNSKVYFEDCLIEANKAQNNGGGIRASMSSSIRLVGGEVKGNTSNYKKNKNTRMGGGGIASRNANLLISGTSITENTAEGWAGGGIQLLTLDSTDLLIPYGRIIKEVFEQQKTVFKLEGTDYKITHNECTFIAGQSSDHRKGGGIYVLRRPFMPIEIEFVDITLVKENIFATSPAPGTPDSLNFHLEDISSGRPSIIDDANISTLTTNNKFSETF